MGKRACGARKESSGAALITASIGNGCENQMYVEDTRKHWVIAAVMIIISIVIGTMLGKAGHSDPKAHGSETVAVIDSDPVLDLTLEGTASAGATYDAEAATIESYSGTMTVKDQVDTYTYTAPTSGTYRIWISDMYADDTLAITMEDSMGYEKFRTMDYNQPGHTVSLDAGESYTIFVKQYRGLNAYTLNIGVAKETVDVTNYSTINDKMEYKEQVNRYKLTAPTSGRYRIWISDMYADDTLAITMEDSMGYEKFRTMDYNQPGQTVSLDAGESYTIFVKQYRGLNTYTLNIGYPKETVDITGYRDVKDSIDYIDRWGTVYNFGWAGGTVRKL